MSIQGFLEEGLSDIYFSGTGQVDLDLAKAVIEQFGGENDFLAQFETVAENGIDGDVEGFESFDELDEFYAVHKNNIHELLVDIDSKETELETPSAIGALARHADQRGVSADELARGIYVKGEHGQNTDEYKIVAQIASELIAQHLCKLYKEFTKYQH